MTVRWTLTGALMLVVLAGCSNPLPRRGGAEATIAPRPLTETASNAVPLQQTVLRDGVQLSLRLDKRSYRSGEMLWAQVRIENQSDRPVYWIGGGCNIPASVSAKVSAWQDPGQLTEYKQWVLARGPDWSRIALEEEHLLAARRRGDAIACPEDIHDVELPVHGILEARLAWDGTVTFLPEKERVPDGPVTLEAQFPLRGTTSSAPLVARLTVTLEGGPVTIVSPGQALDAALGEAQFAAWVNKRLDEEYPATSLELQDRLWQLRASSKLGPGPRSIRVLIDAASGRVVHVEVGEL